MAAILVVDDETEVRRVLRAVLEADGHVVVEAADGPAALDLLGAIMGGRGPDLVVLDVMMPGIDGIEVCRKIDHDRIKVLMLTAKDDAETKADAIAAGAQLVMTKPFSSVDLLEQVRTLTE